MKIVIFAGTRPEAIKMAPVYRKLKEIKNIEALLCSTGQHREMLDQAFGDFGIKPDHDLSVMTQGQTLAGLSSILFAKADAFLAEYAPDWVLVQGDTTTVMVAALCAFYRGIKVGHVEAGLRSGDKLAPFPEEVNRRVAAVVADLHFAPTGKAQENLLKEGFPAENIILTGNTVVDALYWMRGLVKDAQGLLPPNVENIIASHKKLVLVTAHRRENAGEGILSICRSIAELAGQNPDTAFIYPVHLNPAIRKPVTDLLSGQPGVLLSEPLSYKPFVRLMEKSTVILTDSGGLQEEGVIMGKPVLVMRKITERPEGVEAGAARLVGTDRNAIIANMNELLGSPEIREKMSKAGGNLYGDGQAAEKIAQALLR